ncbi:MAG TPA: hypothetical protein VGM69_17845 [Chloroflexota bacterium]|jgi:hypothetical protein
MAVVDLREVRGFVADRAPVRRLGRVPGGAVQQGPAAYPQPRYEARIRDGQVEVRPAG